MTGPHRLLTPTTRALLLLICLLLLTSCGNAAPGAHEADLTGAVAGTTLAPAASVTLVATATPAGAVLPTASTDDLAELSDEFDDPASLGAWQDYAAAEGWPRMFETLDINKENPGQLTIVPLTCSWFADFHGVLLFKTVTGDFDVRTRILATGKETTLPQRNYSLTGLMARTPRSITPQTWTPGGENWVFITTGYGDDDPRREGKPQIETKTTAFSKSRLTLKPVAQGPLDLRVMRVGGDFLMLYRSGTDGPWLLSERFHRTDMPATLQVGISAYTNWDSMPQDDPATFNSQGVPSPIAQPDLIARSDYVRFQRPQLPANVDTTSLSNADWLRLLGE